MASASINVDVGNIIRTCSPASQRRGQFAMANQMLMDMERFVPRLRGNLRAGGRVVPMGSNFAIRYPGPYGRHQFHGGDWRRTVRIYSTPGTGSRWDVKASAAHMPNWRKTLVREMGFS